MATERVAEINVRFDETATRIRAGLDRPRDNPNWAKDINAAVRAIDWSPVSFSDLRKSVPVGQMASTYLRMKAEELGPGGYKALRYCVNLFVSRHKDMLVASLGRDDGKTFLRDIAKLSASLGKSYRYHC